MANGIYRNKLGNTFYSILYIFVKKTKAIETGVISTILDVSELIKRSFRCAKIRDLSLF